MDNTFDKFKREYLTLLDKYNADLIACGYDSLLLELDGVAYPRFNKMIEEDE